MSKYQKWEITKKEQQAYIDKLAAELSTLRAKVGISQGDLAKLIGVSRQTYSSVESGNREMTWNTYLSLILFYDYNKETHNLLRVLGVFPEDLILLFNGGEKGSFESHSIAGIPESITDDLDEAAYQSIRTAVMLEYARCSKLSGDAVIKAFDGVDITRPAVNEKASRALKAIREAKK